MPNLAKFPVIQKRKLFEDVAEHPRQLILSQKLKDGDRLPPEGEQAERFGVGRPSVREALRTLSQMGLVEIRAGEGAFVRKPAFPPFLKSMGDSLGTPARFRVTDVKFHRTIAQAIHNRILLFIHDALSDLMLRTREMALKLPGAAPDAFASHQKIFFAIKNRDRTGAAREMAVHLERVRGWLEKALAKDR